MSKKIYIGQSDLAKEVEDLYIGIAEQAKRVEKAYIGVNGIAKQIYPGIVMYGWNRYNCITNYNWNRYTIKTTQVQRYRVRTSSDGKRVTFRFIQNTVFDYAQSYSFDPYQPYLTLTNFDYVVTRHDYTTEEMADQLRSSGFVGSYITSYGIDYTSSTPILSGSEADEGELTSVYQVSSIVGPYNGNPDWYYMDLDVLNVEKHYTETTQQRGDYVDQISSTNPSSYPSDNYSGSYWYVSAGSTQSQGSLNGSVTSENRNAYPDNGISGNYWYVYTGIVP